MEIKGKVHCFFEQSGTFKREFLKLGIPAEDYDIQDNFGETDHQIDLFAEIEHAYRGEPSVFDTITPDDLIMAFFPCIYFCMMSQYAQSMSYTNYRCLSPVDTIDKILQRQQLRHDYLQTLTKFVRVCLDRRLRMVFENPTTGSFISSFFLKPPTVQDNNRRLRGDYYKKPTGYWFWNCEPTDGQTLQDDKQHRIQQKAASRGKANHSGVCNAERSMISPDYARNFICDFIIGKNQNL